MDRHRPCFCTFPPFLLNKKTYCFSCAKQVVAKNSTKKVKRYFIGVIILPKNKDNTN